jgi:hypothetical protein
MQADPIVIATNAYLDRQAAKEEAHQARFDQLFTELQTALLTDPSRPVSAPGWGTNNATAVEIVNDTFAGRDDTSLVELLALVGRVAQAGGPLGAQAAAWIDARALAFADFYADFVEEA